MPSEERGAMVEQALVLDQEKFATYPQQPHGGKLVDRVATGEERQQGLKRAQTLPKIMVDLEAAITLELIATGVLSPHEGFMNQQEYLSCLETGRMTNGLPWPVPLSFAPIGTRNVETIDSLSVGDEVVLVDEDHKPIALLQLDDIFSYDRDHRAQHIFGTTDRKHPGVDAIYRRMGDTALAGKITLLNRPDWGPFEGMRMEPKETWQLFYEEKKYTSVAGFVTGANPMHRGHEYMQKNLLEEVDALLLLPLVEMAKREYTRHEFRMLAYRSVLDEYYPAERSIMFPLRVTYVFAGPREAVLHALILKNLGCTHKIVGRDYAGVGDYYELYESQSIFDEFTPEELGIDIRFFNEVFYCVRCAQPTTLKTCAHDDSTRIYISGSGIRELLRHGFIPPEEIARPESGRIGIQGVQPKGLNEEGESVKSAGKLIQTMFPYYLTHIGIGGRKREKPLDPQDLTKDDIEIIMLDIQNNAGLIYKQTAQEYARAADINRARQPAWVDKAHEDVRTEQERVIRTLEEKVANASENASDEFMYQSRAEAQKELDVARKILAETGEPITEEDTADRVWNIAPYENYY